MTRVRDGVLVTCQWCGEQVAAGERGPLGSYCSDRCRSRAARGSVQMFFTPCEWCGLLLLPAGPGPAMRFCGSVCRTRSAEARDPERYAEYRARSNRRRSPPRYGACRSCGCEFQVNEGRGRDAHWCRACRRETPDLSDRACEVCGDEFSPTTRRHRFCSRACNLRAWEERRDYHSRNAVRRAQALSGDMDITVEGVCERDGWRCGLCGQRIGRGYSWPHPRSASIDHIVPLSQRGAHRWVNVQASHLACNVAKRDRAVGEQLRLVG